MARSSPRVIAKVLIIAVCVFESLARPEDAKVGNKRSVAKSQILASPLPANKMKQGDFQFFSTQPDELFQNVSEDVVDEKFDDTSFMRTYPQKCVHSEGLCDPAGKPIKNLNISPQTIKYSTKWMAENKTNRSKRMDKLYNLACYYFIPIEGTDSLGTLDLYPDKINPGLCTHLIVVGAEVQNNSVHFQRSFDEEVLRQVANLREQNPQLKVLLSIIDFSNGSHTNEGFNAVVGHKNNLEQFITNLVSVINKFSLDGIDINWQFPSWPIINFEEKYGFAKLLETIRHHLPDTLLTAAVAAPIRIIQKSYLIHSVASAVDFINVMAFDYYAYHSYFPITGPNSPLYSPLNETIYLQNLNINSSIHYWISNGMPEEKILLGMPTYGHSYKLMNEDNNGFYAPTSGPGIGVAGYVTYSEMCELQTHPNVTTVFDHDTLTPYAYHEKDWISFDNENSLAFKAHFATSLGLGGAMVYSLNTDDYSGLGHCALTEFPLTSTIKFVLNNNYHF